MPASVLAVLSVDPHVLPCTVAACVRRASPQDRFVFLGFAVAWRASLAARMHCDECQDGCRVVLS